MNFQNKKQKNITLLFYFLKRFYQQHLFYFYFNTCLQFNSCRKYFNIYCDASYFNDNY